MGQLRKFRFLVLIRGREHFFLAMAFGHRAAAQDRQYAQQQQVKREAAAPPRPLVDSPSLDPLAHVFKLERVDLGKRFAVDGMCANMSRFLGKRVKIKQSADGVVSATGFASAAPCKGAARHW